MQKNDCATIVHSHCIVDRFGQVRTGLDRFGQVRTGVKHYFSSTVSRTLSKFCPPPKPACRFLTVPRSKLYDPLKWWKQPFVTLQLAQGVNWYEVQLFISSVHLYKPYVVRKLSIS